MRIEIKPATIERIGAACPGTSRTNKQVRTLLFEGTCFWRTSARGKRNPYHYARRGCRDFHKGRTGVAMLRASRTLDRRN